MAAYRLRKDMGDGITRTGIIRTSDGANIPDDSENRDWLEYQAWLAVDGNVPDEAEA